jgi:hypothetical protein
MIERNEKLAPNISIDLWAIGIKNRISIIPNFLSITKGIANMQKARMAVTIRVIIGA